MLVRRIGNQTVAETQRELQTHQIEEDPKKSVLHWYGFFLPFFLYLCTNFTFLRTDNFFNIKQLPLP